jgi:cobalt/nickel transport system permease protein
MHIPDAVLSAPVAAACAAVGAAGFGTGLYRLRGRHGDRTPVLMGMMAAFVFAAQMVNFPILPFVSGHLLGGVLAAVVLGPWAGAVAIGAVLIVQALLFADGGLTALGANFVNMGLIGAGVGWAIYATIRRAAGGGPSGTLIGAVVAAWIAVILSAGACAIELAASHGGSTLPTLLGWMALVHAGIGVGEALITGLVVQAILLVRPDLIPGLEPELEPERAPMRWGEVGLAGLAVALAVAVFLGPLAFDAPDGLEYVSERVGLAPEAEAAAEPPAPFPDYRLPGIASLRLATAAAGAVGTLVVFAAAAGLARTLVRRIGSSDALAAAASDAA